MNSTGFKLNGQELRNAQYYGEFKSSMYRLAAEQLPRWQSWKLFSWDNIARMEEVETTSECAQLMLNGIVGKTQRAINKLYEQKDEVYPERREVERRFQAVMDMIDDSLSSQFKDTVFTKRPLFYALFAAIYENAYGINSELKKKKAKPLPGAFAVDAAKMSDLIESGKVPAEVAKALERRTTHPSSRKTIIGYIQKKLKIA